LKFRFRFKPVQTRFTESPPCLNLELNLRFSSGFSLNLNLISGSVQFGSGPNLGSELNLSITNGKSLIGRFSLLDGVTALRSSIR
jgi:hypothetical protein